MRNPHEPDPLKGAAALARAMADNIAPPDTFRLALIRIDFRTDRAGSETSGDGHFDLSAPDTTLPPIDRAPHDSAFYAAHLEALKRYYEAQSYGRSVIVGDVWPRSRNGAYSVSDMADFGPWKFSREIYRDAVHMFRTMLFAADSQSVELGDRIPWDTYDRFMIVHAGSDFQSDLRGDSPLDIPSFTIGVDDTDVVIFAEPDSTIRPIDRAAVVPETANQDGFYGALNGVIAHENGHNVYGMADLYNVQSGYPVVGLWSLMDSGNLTGSPVGLPNGDEIFATGLLPPSVDPFQAFLH
jgi:M6 family metalloprotease-like protein